MEEHHSVIVIGAGLSGVYAAKLLHDKKIDVLVLEANNRIGGRLYSIENEKCGYTDLGGAYLGPEHKRVFHLMKELGLKTYKVPPADTALHYIQGQRKIEAASMPVPTLRHPVAFMDHATIWRTIEDLSQQVPPDAPWNAPDAEKLDSITFKEWVDRKSWTKSMKDTIKVFSTLNFAAEPHEVSLLWALWYLREAGGIASIGDTEGGAQEQKVQGGAMYIPVGAAKQLGDRVLLNHPVTKIEYCRTGAKVFTDNGKTFKADHLIIAIPPALQMKIHFSPALPPHRNQLIQRVPMGSVIKTMTYYSEPYWRHHGLCGEAWIESDDPDLPIIGALDDTKPDGSFPALMGFVLGDKAKELSHLSKEERKVMIAKSYAKIYNVPELAHPIHYEEKNWCEEPWAGGCYTGWMAPGVLTQFGRYIREPLGCMHFAGTETATEWSGYMEGAMQAGERAVSEVLQEMGQLTQHWLQPQPSAPVARL